MSWFIDMMKEKGVGDIPMYWFWIVMVLCGGYIIFFTDISFEKYEPENETNYVAFIDNSLESYRSGCMRGCLDITEENFKGYNFNNETMEKYEKEHWFDDCLELCSEVGN